MNINEFLRYYPTGISKRRIRPRVYCKDGFHMSVQASLIHYCDPQKDNAGLYETVEIGYPYCKIEELIPFAEDPECLEYSIYGRVPIKIVDAILEKHGGIVGSCEYDNNKNLVVDFLPEFKEDLEEKIIESWLRRC